MNEQMTVSLNNTIRLDVTKKDNKARCFLFLIIAITVLSLSIATTMMMNTQASYGLRSGDGKDTDLAIQMGVCVVGVKSPCNGDR